jgi:hypothetical protein
VSTFILPGRWSGSQLEIEVENGSSLADFSFKKGRSYFCVLPVRTTGGRVVQSFKLDDDEEGGDIKPEDAAIVIERDVPSPEVEISKAAVATGVPPKLQSRLVEANAAAAAAASAAEVEAAGEKEKEEKVEEAKEEAPKESKEVSKEKEEEEMQQETSPKEAPLKTKIQQYEEMDDETHDVESEEMTDEEEVLDVEKVYDDYPHSQEMPADSEPEEEEEEEEEDVGRLEPTQRG